MQPNDLLKTCLIAGWLILLTLSSGEIGKASAQGKLGKNEIKTAVETWVREWTPDARPDAVIGSLEPYEEEGETFAYIARLKGGGYCLCGADPLVLPVYLYASKGSYDPKNPGCKYVLHEIAERLRYLRKALSTDAPEIRPYRGRLSRRANDWSLLARRRTPFHGSGGRDGAAPKKIELELTCKWHQDSPYNDQCPNLSPGYDEHVYVGCNATAVTQIMYYWQWPTHGIGSHTWRYDYRWRTIGSWDSEHLSIDPGIPPNWPKDQIGSTKYERLRWNGQTKRLEMTGYWDESLYNAAAALCSDPAYIITLATLYLRLTPNSYFETVYPGNATYDWSLIEDQHSDPPDPGDQEVAELCNHIGNTITSTWGIVGTGSNFIYSAPAL